jgi:hypothetical protein
MLPITRSWLDGLGEFATEQRRTKPLVTPASAAEQAAERSILAAQLSTWLTGFDDVLACRRAWLAEGDADGDPDPAIVITTSAVGVPLVGTLTEAGSLPARSLSGRVVAVTELEYRLWCVRQPDEHHHAHVNVWNWIKTRVPRQRHAEFQRHPLGPGEAYWLHRAGIAGAGEADRRDCHLWKWTGRHAALLEAFVVERGVAELGGAAEA